MKNTIISIALTCMMALLHTSIHAQDNDEIKTPALHLQKAGNSALVGYTFWGLAGLSMAAAPEPEEVAPFAGALAVAGLIYQVRAWVQIKKAGKLMEQNRLSLNSNNYGVGLKWSLVAK